MKLSTFFTHIFKQVTNAWVIFFGLFSLYTCTIPTEPILATFSSMNFSNSTVNPTFSPEVLNYTIYTTENVLTVSGIKSVFVDKVETQKTTTQVNNDNFSIINNIDKDTIIAILTNLAQGKNTRFQIKTTGRNSATSVNYNILVNRVIPVKLNNLTIGSGVITPNFDPNRNNYTIIISNPNIKFTATASNLRVSYSLGIGTTASNAQIDTNGNLTNLNLGSTSEVLILVAGEEEASNRTYSFNVIYTLDALLRTLDGRPDGGSSFNLSPMFESLQTGYISSTDAPNLIIETTTVNTEKISKIIFTKEPSLLSNDPNSTVEASGQINNMTPGLTTKTVIAIKNIDENKIDKVYILTVTRFINGSLSNLTFNPDATLSPSFDTTKSQYSIEVTEPSITINAIQTQGSQETTFQQGLLIIGNDFNSTVHPITGLVSNMTIGKATRVIMSVGGIGFKSAREYVLDITRQAGGDLTNLTASPVIDSAFQFSSSKLSYDVTTEENSITINATGSTATQSIEYSKDVPNSSDNNSMVNSFGVVSNLTSGETTKIIITVRSSDLGSKQYTVNIQQITKGLLSTLNVTNSSNNTLSLEPTFSSSTYNYKAFTSTTAISNATIDAIGNQNITIEKNPQSSTDSFSSYSNQELTNIQPGFTTQLSITVEGIGNNSNTTYLLNIIGSQNGTLSNLTLSNGILIPGFNANTTSYTADIFSSSTTIQVMSVINQEIEFSKDLSSNDDNSIINSNVSNAVITNITAGNTTVVNIVVSGIGNGSSKTYQITLTGQATGITSLTLDNTPTLTPSFDRNTINYQYFTTSNNVTINPIISNPRVVTVSYSKGMAINNNDPNSSVDLSTGAINNISSGKATLLVVTEIINGVSKIFNITVQHKVHGRLTSIIFNPAFKSNTFDDVAGTLNYRLIASTNTVHITSINANGISNDSISYSKDNSYSNISSTVNTANGTIINTNLGDSVRLVITVKGIGGGETGVYNMDIIRGVHGYLNSLSFINGNTDTLQLNNNFDKTTLEYTASTGKDNFQIVAIAENPPNPNNIISITKDNTNSNDVLSNVNGINLTNLTQGKTTRVNIKVNGQHGGDTNTYIIDITRGTDGILHSLTTSGNNIVLSPIFDPNTTSYQLTTTGNNVRINNIESNNNNILTSNLTNASYNTATLTPPNQGQNGFSTGINSLIFFPDSLTLVIEIPGINNGKNTQYNFTVKQISNGELINISAGVIADFPQFNTTRTNVTVPSIEINQNPFQLTITPSSTNDNTVANMTGGRIAQGNTTTSTEGSNISLDISRGNPGTDTLTITAYGKGGDPKTYAYIFNFDQ